jgi:hypothetical protein
MKTNLVRYRCGQKVTKHREENEDKIRARTIEMKCNLVAVCWMEPSANLLDHSLLLIPAGTEFQL